MQGIATLRRGVAALSLVAAISGPTAAGETFTVGNLNDSGPGSLRQAIQDANAHPGADVVRFAPGLGGVITLTSGPLEITDSLTIDGPGADRLAVSGGDTTRVFHVAGASASLAGLTITRGHSSQGAGLYNAGGNVRLALLRFAGNQVTGDGAQLGLGGAIWNGGGGTLAVERSEFTENAGQGGGPLGPFSPAGLGGAIWNGGGAALEVDRCAFFGNRLAAAPTALVAGGAIANQGAGASLRVADSTFAQNEAAGGALCAGGAVVNFGAGTATLSRCSFTRNRTVGGPGAPGADGGFGVGGGVMNTSIRGIPSLFGGVMHVEDCSFIENAAIGGDGGNGLPGGNAGRGQLGGGGGLFNDIMGTVHVRRCRFAGNRAITGRGGRGGDGGGNGGTARPGEGGGLKNLGGRAFVSDSLFLQNLALGGNGGAAGRGGQPGRGGPAEGGGLLNRQDPGVTNQGFFGTATVTRCRFLGNAAIGGNGAPGADGGPALGGGAFNEFGCTLAFEENAFEVNLAAGGSGVNGGDGLGGGIFTDHDTTLDLVRDVIDGNRAAGGAGSPGVDGAGRGGGLYITLGAVVRGEETVIHGNSATTGDDEVFGAFTSG